MNILSWLRKPKNVCTIVSPGRGTPKDRLYEFRCWCCNCVFRFMGRDAYWWFVGSVLFVQKRCPQCNEEISINDPACGEIQ